jgi:BirA family biotin operon repressor/biotin-[acetyl-CoA-carboxylase] ligase
LEVILEIVSRCIASELERLGHHDFETLKTEYEHHLFRKNSISVFETKDNKRHNGIIHGISDTGELCVKMEDESLQFFKLKELRLLY